MKVATRVAIAGRACVCDDQGKIGDSQRAAPACVLRIASGLLAL